MRYTNKRTYPVTHRKKNPVAERSVDLSLAAAAGVLVFIFAKGFFWGYVVKRWMDK